MTTLNSGNMLSSSAQSKIDKEKIAKLQEQEPEPVKLIVSDIECGIDNPCVFGKQSPTFEKDIKKRKSI
jgi:hypothetical protein